MCDLCHSRACVCVRVAFATSSERRSVCVALVAVAGGRSHVGTEGFSFNTPLLTTKARTWRRTARRVDRRSRVDCNLG